MTRLSLVTGLWPRGRGRCLSEPVSLPASRRLGHCVRVYILPRGPEGEAGETGDFWGLRAGRKGDPRGPFLFYSISFHKRRTCFSLPSSALGERRGLGRGGHTGPSDQAPPTAPRFMPRCPSSSHVSALSRARGAGTGPPRGLRRRRSGVRGMGRPRREVSDAGVHGQGHSLRRRLAGRGSCSPVTRVPPRLRGTSGAGVQPPAPTPRPVLCPLPHPS